jgi:isopentenyldiphosphate isomerase
VADKQDACTMFFLNPRGEVLLLLRDNNPAIPYPNMWDLPGGHMEQGESPSECIRREMCEELPGWTSVTSACTRSWSFRSEPTISSGHESTLAKRC